MINTIFYFAPDSFDEQAYRNGLDSENGVSSRTIVFSPSQKAIYKGGVRYGSMSIEDMKEYITQILQQDPTIINNGSDYDDSAIRALIDAERDRINQLLANMDQSIINKMNQLFNDKNWLDTNVIDKIQSYSNFGEEEVDNYLQRIGLYTVDGNGRRIWKWSSIAQDVDSIELEVNQIKSNQQIGGLVDYELLASNVYAYINDNAASAGLRSTWGKFLELTDGELRRLLWMQSTVDTYAADSTAFGKLLAAAQEYDNTGKTQLTQALAGVNALVQKDQSNYWVASSSLSSLIDDEVASIQTIVRKDANTGRLESDVVVSADNVDINGLVLTQDGYVSRVSSGDLIAVKYTLSDSGLAIDDTVTHVHAKYYKTYAEISDYIEGDGTVRISPTQIVIDGNGTSNLTHDKITITPSQLVFESENNTLIGISGGSNGMFEVIDGSSYCDINATSMVIHDGRGYDFFVVDSEGNGGNGSFLTNANVEATGFKIIGSDDTYVLLAGGGTAALSSLGGGSSSWNGGSITGDITLNSGAKIVDSANDISIDSSNGLIKANKFYTPSGEVRVGADGAGIYSNLSTDTFVMYDPTAQDNVILLDGANGGDIEIAGTLTSSNGTCQGSDITKKDVIADTTITVDQIADAPSIQFTWKTDANKTPHVGTSAQYWQTVMPEVITEKNDTVFMDYSSAALVSAITIAKEVVSLKEEIAQLKQQIAELKGNNNE